MSITSTLFVIPNDHGISAFNKEFIRLLKLAIDLNHEIGLHGYAHTKNEFGYLLPFPLPTYGRQKELLKKGKDYLREQIGESPVGFRAPGYRHSTTTLKALVSLGFAYDSSETVFKPAYGIRFRIKTFVDPKIYRIKGLTEIPVTGDYIYNLKKFRFSAVLKRAINDFDWVKNFNGVFVLNNHVQCLNRMGFNFLEEMIKRITGKTNFVKLVDLTEARAKIILRNR
jgi:peptidoglycan/xylan/chitin deacetylase (PgdA/CDA1 family)